MYIRRIVINNVRGFGEGKVDLDLDRGRKKYAGWTVIAGRNGAGKTTLLRAVALAMVGRNAAVRLADSFAGWIHADASHAEIRVEVVPTPDDQFSGKGARPQWFELALRWDTIAGKPEPRLSDAFEYAPKDRLRAPLRGPWSENPNGWFLAGYGPFRRLSGHAADAQRVMGGAPPVARLGTLFREDASLLEAVEWLKDLRLRAADKDNGAERLLASAFALLNDGLLPNKGMRVTRIDADGLWVHLPRGVELRLQDLSDGYRAVAALVLDLLHCIHATYGAIDQVEDKPPRVRTHGVVMIDEVDAHLHVSWQQKIGPWLREHFPNIQFLVTSHSPFVCQAADPRGLIVLPSPGSEAPARVADEALYYRTVNGPADTALLSELFGLEHTWSDAAQGRRDELARLEAKVLAGRADASEKKQYNTLRESVLVSAEDEVLAAVSKLSAARGARP